MKRLVLALLVAIIASSVVAFRAAEAPTADFLAALGLTESQAHDHVFRSFWTSYLSHPTGARVRAVATGDRAAMVREIGTFARGYVASPAFRARYDSVRAGARPVPPEAAGSADDQVSELKADLQKQIAEMEEQAKTLPPDMRQQFLAAADALREQMKALDAPDSFMRDPSYQAAMEAGAAEEMAEYRDRLARWEAEYPTDPDARVAARLSAMVAECADVDFGATLVDGEGGKKLFANAAYERKPALWKACYRAGPEAVDAARAVAREWQASLR